MEFRFPAIVEPTLGIIIGVEANDLLLIRISGGKCLSRRIKIMLGGAGVPYRIMLIAHPVSLGLRLRKIERHHMMPPQHHRANAEENNESDETHGSSTLLAPARPWV